MATKGIGRPLTILLQGDTSGLGKALQQAQTGLNKFSNQVDKAAKVAAVAFAGVAAAGYDAAKAAAADQLAATNLAGDLKASTNATDAQIKSTEEWITKLSLATGVADDELRPALARLVRSTGDISEAQTLANLALDISARTGKDSLTVANALAKANDGQFNALKKLGITLGDNAQNAAALVKENNNLAKAQRDAQVALDEYGPSSKEYAKALDKVKSAQDKVNTAQAAGVDWVKELSDQFGGAAAEKAGTAQGSFERLKVAIDESKEAIGYGLLPFVTKLADKLQVIAPFIERNAEVITKLGVAVAATSGSVLGLKFAIDAVQVTMKVATVTSSALKIAYLTVAAATGSAAAAQQLAELTYVKSTAAAIAYKVAMLAQAGAAKIATASQWALNVALNANPIGLIVLGVAALATAFVVAYKKIEPFRKLVDSIWEKIKGITDTIKNSALGKAVGKLLGIETRATGGPVRQGRSYLVGENGPELFTATGSSGSISPAGSFGSGQVVNITINGAIDPEGTRRALEQLFQRSSRRTGAVNLIGGVV